MKRKGSRLLVHDEAIQEAVPASEWERVRAELDEDRSTRIYPFRCDCRWRESVSAKLTELGFTLPPYIEPRKRVEHRNKVAS